MTKRLIVGIALLGCLALCIDLQSQAAPTSSSSQAVAAGSHRCAMKNDASWAQQYLADGFLGGQRWGEWQTKAEFIEDLQNKTNKWKSGNISDVHVATFGSSTAIAHYKFTYDADINGKHRARSVICSDTWEMNPAHGNQLRPTARWFKASNRGAAQSLGYG